MSEQKKDADAENAVNFVGDIAEFHEKFGLNYDGKPRLLSSELSVFRARFMQEELNEYDEARCRLMFSDEEIAEALEHQLDALVDLVYVAIGTAYMHGFNFSEAWRRVHAANMSKVRAEKAEDSKRGTTFDVVKPKGWQPPSHFDLVIDHAHKGDK